MKGSLLAAAVVTAFACDVHALHYEKRDNPKAVHMPLARQQPSAEKREAMRQRRWNRLGKRDKTVQQTLDNFEEGSLYFANVTLGTPAQKFRFHVDTGSSDLWANSATSRFCQMGSQVLEQEGYESCDVSGTYRANSSSTYKYVNSGFYISYADSTGASGDYVTDVLKFGDSSVTGQQFGVGYQSNSSEGVMGIGYPNLEVAVQYDRDAAYDNIPQNMAKLGLINTPAYSLWLDDLDSATGNILFGGVDTTKFTGSLTTVPILKENNAYLEMLVGLSSIDVSNNGKNSSIESTATPVLLDSGSTLAYLPTKVAQAIYRAVGATYNERIQAATCECSLADNNNIFLEFNFSGARIRVDMSQMVLQESRSTCIFGIMPQDGTGTYTLGDTFIRNAYIVYDLESNTISMAQTKFNVDSDSEIHEIQKGTVPSATAASNPATPAVGQSGNAYNGGFRTASSSTGAVAKATPAPVAAWGAAAVGAGVMMAAL